MGAMLSTVADQRLAALAQANVVKHARMILLHRLYQLPCRESSRMAADVLDDVPEVLATLRVDRFLQRVRKADRGSVHGPRVSPSHANARCRTSEQWLAAAEINPVSRLGELTPRQRAGLAGALRMSAELTR